jgi:cytochrome b6-f complex iron-sulfur subunit
MEWITLSSRDSKQNREQSGPACKCFSRRTFIAAGVGGLLAASSGGLYASVKALYPTVSYEPPLKVEIGPVDEFVGGAMKQVQVGGRKISIMQGENGLYALVRNCTHMGCIPYFSDEEEIFRCPCHGSSFTLEGDVIKGPAPEPLYRAAITVNPRGMIEVNAGVVENDVRRRSEPPFSLKV